jgi:ATP/maltotriose-dependent transcriptional regulator MalT
MSVAGAAQASFLEMCETSGMRSPQRGVPAKISRPVMVDVHLRARLFRRLDLARRRPVVWIASPAGSGKTTLLGSYVRARSLPCLWYMADSGDGDVATLFHYLGLAATELARGARRRLRPWSSEYPAEVAAFSRRYFETLFASLPRRSLIVFDDYQEVPADSAFHEALREGLAVLPAGLNAVVLSREEPPPAFIERVAAGAVGRLGWDDLRLSGREAVAVAQRRLGRRAARPHKRALERLHDMTDGWAAGLVLLLEHEGRALVEQQPAELDARAAIFDYFAAEVFAGCEPRLQELLVRTAHLPTMSAAAAAKVAGVADAGQALDRLSRHGFFIERRGSSRRVFRYHPLFRAFLLERAVSVLGPDTLRQVRREAARLLVEDDQLHEALALFRQAGDLAALAGVVIERAPILLAQGRIETMRALLGAVPEQELEAHTWLAYWRATCVLGHDPAAALGLFARAFERFRAEGDAAGTYEAWAGAVQAIVLEGHDFRELDRWIEIHGALQEQRRGYPSPEIEARVAAAMVMAYTRTSRCLEGRPWAERALALSRQQPDQARRLTASAFLLLFRAESADMAGAATLVPVLERALGDEAADPLARITVALALSRHAMVMGRLPRCAEMAETGLAIAERTGLHVLDHELRIGAGNAGLLTGDVGRWSRWIIPFGGDRLTRMQAGGHTFATGLRSLVEGDLESALRIFEEGQPFADAAGMGLGQILGLIALAQTLHGLGRASEACARIERGIAVAQDLGSPLFLHWCLATYAQIAAETGDRARALDLCRQLFALGRTHGLLGKPWHLAPAPFAGLCARALASGIEPDHVRALITENDLAPPADGDVDLAAWPWPVRITTLGGFEVAGPATLATARKVSRVPLRALKALIALGGADVRAEALADALWPEAEGDAAARNLETAVHRLRKLLGRHDAVQVRAGAVTLDRRRCWVDAWAVDSLCAQVQRAPAGADASSLAARLLALYRGPFLPNEPDAPWAARHRQRLRRRFSAALATLAARGETGSVPPWLERALDADPLLAPRAAVPAASRPAR